MGGGLMQLVAYGAQDVYLTGNPQITFFKVVYRRHTNFSMEAIEQTFNGTADFGKKVSATVSRNGDLITNMYLELGLPAAGSGKTYADNAGFAIIKNVELEVGGQQIDKHFGEWMHVWSELTVSDSRNTALEAIVDNGSANTAKTVTVPLYFYFCRNPGLALPLIALQYHEVKINVEFESIANSVINVSSGLTLSSAKLWVDYIYLDTDERRRFAQVSHEYLIEQLQTSGDETCTSGANKIRLNFNHPVKELVFVGQHSTASTAGSGLKRFDFTSDGNANAAQMITNAKLQLNGHDRFAQRNGDYFNYVQPFQHHTASPALGINCYSFALKPEEHQPSGTCNFSRIDNATLNLTTAAACTARIYAVNYNVLRVMSGMGGLAYSN
jgi:hypothetical protein